MGNGNKAVAYPTDRRTGIGDGQKCRAIGQDEKFRKDVRGPDGAPQLSARWRRERPGSKKCDVLRRRERLQPGPKHCDALRKRERRQPGPKHCDALRKRERRPPVLRN